MSVTSRIVQWLLQLSEFDISILTLWELRCQVFSDLLAQFLYGEHKPSYMKTCIVKKYVIKDDECRLAYNGSSIHRERGERTVLYDLDGIVFLSSRLECNLPWRWVWSCNCRADFCLTNENSNAWCVWIFRLITKQVSGEFAHKEITLVTHQSAVHKLIKFFLNIRFKHLLELMINKLMH